MISLAIVLGLISGFLPTFTFINYVILFFVFIFRIPLGLYFASYAVFSLISYLLDPLFNQIGYFILTFKPLEGIWTFLYNLPFLRWSGFNNTLVMGSLVSGIIIGIILYIILNRSIDVYREKLFPKLKKIKFLSWIVPKEEKKGIFRFSGLIAFGVIFAAITLIISLFLDPFVKTVMEFSLSKTLNKKVSIKSVNVSLLNTSIDIDSMQIDTFLIKKAYMKFNTYYLLWKKFEIEKMIVDAKTNQSLVALLNKNKSKSLSEKLNISLNVSVPKATDILQTYKPKSLEAVKKLQDDYKQLKSLIGKNNNYKSQIDKIGKKVSSLSKVKIKTPQDLERIIKDVKSIQKDIDNLKKDIKTKKEELLKLKNRINEDIKLVKKAAKEDYAYVESKYNMIRNKEYFEFTKSILAPKLKEYLQIAQNVYQKIAPYLPKKENKQIPQIPRKGIYIKFEDKIKYPDFLIKDSLVKLKTSIAKYQVTLKDIADNQEILNKEAKINFKGVSKFYEIFGDIRYLNKTSFLIKGKNIKLNVWDLGKVKIFHPVIAFDLKGEYKDIIKALFDIYVTNAKFSI
jgi:uncharacterized protein (TIGR03545 family)/uncharacterized protein (TIGR03546 family)